MMQQRMKQVGPAILRRINEQKVLGHLRIHGPASRARLRRVTGLTAPTVSKVVESLVLRGLLEEIDPTEPGVGRPGKLVRLAQDTAVVLGVLIDAGQCTVTAAGIDGRINEDLTCRFEPPASYTGLLQTIEAACRRMLAGVKGRPQGVAVVVNGLINQAEQRVLCCANLHVLDGQDPAGDLEARLGLWCRLFKGTSALCLGERTSGSVTDQDNFAVLDMTTGLGLGAFSNGILLSGHSGLGGEIGHVVVDPGGFVCGCGNRGCLETLATDAAVIRLLSEQIGQPLDPETAVRILAEHPARFTEVIDTVAHHLAMAAAMVATMLNPGTILIHSDLFLSAAGNLDAVSARLARLGLHASVADCVLRKTTVSKAQAAVAGIIHEITRPWFPSDSAARRSGQKPPAGV